MRPQLKNITFGNCLVVHWLGLCISTARGTGSILGRETKTPHAILHSQKIKNKLSWRPWLWLIKANYFPGIGVFPGGSDGKECACNARDLGLMRQENPLEKGMATHSSIFQGPPRPSCTCLPHVFKCNWKQQGDIDETQAESWLSLKEFGEAGTCGLASSSSSACRHPVSSCNTHATKEKSMSSAPGSTWDYPTTKTLERQGLHGYPRQQILENLTAPLLSPVTWQLRWQGAHGPIRGSLN